MTIKEYIDTGILFPFYDATQPKSTPQILQTDTMQEEIKSGMMLLYGNYDLRELYVNDVTLIPPMCNNIYTLYHYKYDGLLKSEEFDYEPLENYRMTETGKEENSGTDKTTLNKGKQTDADTDKTTLNKGKQSDTDTIGSRSDKVENGAQKSESIDSVAPYETSTFRNKDKNVTSVDAYTQTATQGEQKNTHSAGERTDTTNTERTHEDGERTDTTSLEHGHNVEHELTRYGNIGITTSQQMLLSEREVRDFSTIKIICSDLAHYLCVGVYAD